MTSRERVLASVRGKPVDRPPFALWRHFYDRESSGARDLADAMIGWAREYDFDLLKYNPRARYHGEPWDFGWPDRTVDLSHPTFAEMLEGLRLARAALADLPIVMTVFTPLAIVAGQSEDAAAKALAMGPARLEAALEVVTETFARFAAACLEAGADGIFLATTSFGSRDTIGDADYSRFGRPYDVRLLEAVASAPLNILHVCGDRSRVLGLAAYPHVAAVSWNAHGAGNPPLTELHGRIAVGGISDAALLDPDVSQVRDEVRAGSRRRAASGGSWPAAARSAGVERAVHPRGPRRAPRLGVGSREVAERFVTRGFPDTKGSRDRVRRSNTPLQLQPYRRRQPVRLANADRSDLCG